MATVHAAEKFHYAADGEKLRSEMKGFGTDEQAIIAVLTSRSHEQRLTIVNYFTQEYDRELLEELKEELGEKFDDLTYGLIGTNAEQYAYELNSLLENELSDENSLIEILATRSVDEIKEIAKQYAKTYERALVGHIGDASPARRLAASIINGANSDQSVADVIKNETSDELKAVVAIAAEAIENPVTFFANRLNGALEGDLNNKTLTRIITTRSEIDLANIKTEYERLFSRALSSDVKSKTNDDYKKALCALLGED